MSRTIHALPMLVLASALSTALPAAAEIKDQSAQGFTLENSRTVPVVPDKAWEALVNEVGLWWPDDHTWWGKSENLRIEAKAGGCFCEINGEHQAWHMSVVFVDPPNMLRMTGGLGPLQGMGMSGVMEWRLQPTEDGGTTITLHYRAGGYVPQDISGFVPVVDKVQGLQLGGLADHLTPKAP